MNKLQYARDKFKGRDQIEISSDTQVKMINWMSPSSKDGQEPDLRKVCQKLSERGFIKFLNKGVILIKYKDEDENIRFYPFEFTDTGTLIVSVYVSNPFSTNQESSLELLAKVECGTDTKFKILEGTYNEDLAIHHIANEFEQEKISVSRMLPIIKEVNKKHPDVEGNSEEWRKLVAQEYFNNVIKIQIISVIATNAYLSLLNKEILVSRITQERVMKASDRKDAKKSKRNPFYRYIVSLPDGYKPRKFNLNYLLSEWERSGHMTTKWVREENADILAERKGGKVLGRKRGEYVAIQIPIAPQTCRRKAVSVKQNPGNKTYDN